MAPFSGTKFCYDVYSEQWRQSGVRLDVTDSPCGEGGMRLAYHAAELDTRGNTSVASVVKVFKGMNSKAAMRACFDEAMTQMIADSYAQEYNRARVRDKVAFLPVSVVKLQSPFQGSLYVCLEPLMSGPYVKHSDNAGHIGTKADIPQAFSHFTYESSNHLLVVCDIQGQGVDMFTDPQIHSFDGKSFGLGNLGSDGIRRFKRSHRCNSICATLGLPRLTTEPVGCRPGAVVVGGGHQPAVRKESDRQMAERLQAEEYAKARGSGSGREQPHRQGNGVRRVVWDAQKYDDTIVNAMRFFNL